MLISKQCFKVLENFRRSDCKLFGILLIRKLIVINVELGHGRCVVLTLIAEAHFGCEDGYGEGNEQLHFERGGNGSGRVGIAKVEVALVSNGGELLLYHVPGAQADAAVGEVQRLLVQEEHDPVGVSLLASVKRNIT